MSARSPGGLQETGPSERQPSLTAQGKSTCGHMTHQCMGRQQTLRSLLAVQRRSARTRRSAPGEQAPSHVAQRRHKTLSGEAPCSVLQGLGQQQQQPGRRQAAAAGATRRGAR